MLLLIRQAVKTIIVWLGVHELLPRTVASQLIAWLRLATACVLAIALSGSAREMSSAGVANWCANAAIRTFNAFDESVPQPLRRPERRPETINAEKAR